MQNETNDARKDLKSFSFSKIDTYNQCAFKYMLHYFEDDKIFAANIALELGTLIHGTEEEIANCIKDGKPINYKALKNNIVLKVYELEHKYPAEFKEPDKTGHTYREKIDVYLDSGIYRLEKYLKEHPELEVVATEQKFKIMYHNHQFTGSIDRVLKNKITGEYICHDIKTWPEPHKPEELTTPLQFVVYTLAMKELYGIVNEEVKCAYDLPFCDLIQEAGTKGYMTRGTKKLDKLFEGIENKNWEPNPSALCHWCPYCPTNKNQPRGAENRCPYFCHYTKQDNKNWEKENEWQGIENHQKVLEHWLKNKTK